MYKPQRLRSIHFGLPDNMNTLNDKSTCPESESLEEIKQRLSNELTRDVYLHCLT